jgi:hypothetical protein
MRWARQRSAEFFAGLVQAPLNGPPSLNQVFKTTTKSTSAQTTVAMPRFDLAELDTNSGGRVGTSGLAIECSRIVDAIDTHGGVVEVGFAIAVTYAYEA